MMNQTNVATDTQQNQDPKLQRARESKLFERTIRGFYVIHVLLTLLLFAGLFLLFGCANKDLEEIDDGPATPVETKDKMIRDALGTRTILDTQTGEWVNVAFSQRAYSGSPVLTGLSTLQIFAKEDKGEYFAIKVITNDVNYTDTGQTVQNKYLDEYEIKKIMQLQSPSSRVLIRDSRILPAEQPYSGIGVSPCAQESAKQVVSPGYSVSYHNLKQELVTEAPPEEVSKKPNCGGIPNCQIKKINVSYDEIIHNDLGGRLRYRCTFGISQDVPFLANVMNKCINFLATSGARKVPVNLCMDVINFTFGSNTPKP